MISKGPDRENFLMIRSTTSSFQMHYNYIHIHIYITVILKNIEVALSLYQHLHSVNIYFQLIQLRIINKKVLSYYFFQYNNNILSIIINYWLTWLQSSGLKAGFWGQPSTLQHTWHIGSQFSRVLSNQRQVGCQFSLPNSLHLLSLGISGPVT